MTCLIFLVIYQPARFWSGAQYYKLRRERVVKPRGVWDGSNTRSRELCAKRLLCYAGQFIFDIYKEVLDFCFMLNLHARFLQTIYFFYIQISSILESQFNINRHFAFSREDARDPGNNAEIWQFFLIKSIFILKVFLTPRILLGNKTVLSLFCHLSIKPS